MKKSVILMVGLLAMALAGSAQAATMFAVQDATATDVFAVANDGQITAANLTFKPATKKFGFGTTNPLTSLHIVETAGNFDRGLTIQQIVAGASAAVINIKKSAGTEAIPTFPSSPTNIAAIHGQVWDGNATANANGFTANASILMATDPGTYALNNIPTYIAFATGNGGPGSAATNPWLERFRITYDGRMRLSNQPAAPVSGSTVCTTGDMILDAASGFLYLCTNSTGSVWKKATFN